MTGDLEVGVVAADNDLVRLFAVVGRFNRDTGGYRLLLRFEDTQLDDDISIMKKKFDTSMR
jgi:hypothetical protein